MDLSGARAILFDKDGTLFDFQKSWGAFCASVICEIADGDQALAVRLSDAAGFDISELKFQPESLLVSGAVREIAELWASISGHWRVDALETLINGEAASDVEMIPATPDLAGVLGQLRLAGLKLGVATNDSEGAARAQLVRAGVLDRFDFIAGYDSGHGAKPNPGMITAFAASSGVPTDALIMVGDSLHDLRAGRAAGAMALVGVLTGPAPRAVLETEATLVLGSIGELPAALGI